MLPSILLEISVSFTFRIFTFGAAQNVRKHKKVMNFRHAFNFTFIHCPISACSPIVYGRKERLICMIANQGKILIWKRGIYLSQSATREIQFRLDLAGTTMNIRASWYSSHDAIIRSKPSFTTAFCYFRETVSLRDRFGRVLPLCVWAQTFNSLWCEYVMLEYLRVKSPSRADS